MSSIASKRFVVIIPTFNEALNIERCVNIVFKSFPKNNEYDFHILIVDGDSQDDTANIVRKLIPENSKLHLLVEKEKSGLGSAYVKGMDYAFYELKATHVFQFDADLSHDATKIKDFISKVEEGYELVLGTRYIKGGSIPDNWAIHRKLLSKLGNIFITVLFFPNRQISDWTGGFKCISKNVYEKVKSKVSVQKGYTFTISFNKAAVDCKVKIAEIPFSFKDRTLGKSKLGVDYFFNAFYFVLKSRFLDLFKNKFIRVCFVGSIGALIQTTTYLLFRSAGIRIFISQNLSIELAILSNFLFNNFFTFKDRKIVGNLRVYARKFIFFNLLSFGSIIIQNVVMHFGLAIFPNILHIELILLILGILLGLVVNFIFYSKIIWKKQK